MAGGDWEDQCLQIAAKTKKCFLGQICQFDKTQPWPKSDQLQAQVVECLDLLCSFVHSIRESQNVITVHVELKVFASETFSTPVCSKFFSSPFSFLSCGIALMLLWTTILYHLHCVDLPRGCIYPNNCCQEPIWPLNYVQSSTKWVTRTFWLPQHWKTYPAQICQIIDNRFYSARGDGRYLNPTKTVYCELSIVDSIES